MRKYAKFSALFVVVLGAWGTVATLLYYFLFEQSFIYVLHFVFAVPGTILAGYAYLKSRSVPLSHFRIFVVGVVLIAMGSSIPIFFMRDLSPGTLGGLALDLGILGAAVALNHHVVQKEGTSG